VVSNDSADDGQPQAGALVDGLCREEGLKDAPQDVRGHSMARIADGQPYMRPWVERGMGRGDIDRHVDRLDAHVELPTRVTHGVFCINAEIHEHLVYLDGIGEDRARSHVEVWFAPRAVDGCAPWCLLGGWPQGKTRDETAFQLSITPYVPFGQRGWAANHRLFSTDRSPCCLL
jgi:hypothetical protein